MLWQLLGAKNKPVTDKENTDKFKIYLYAITILVLVAVVWTMLFLDIKLDIQAIPTLVNGITSSTSVIIGFCGAFIGIMFHETNKNDKKTREFYMIAIILLLIPLTMLWSTYALLAMNWSSVAVRYGLSGLIASLYVFISVVIYSVRALSSNTGNET